MAGAGGMRPRRKALLIGCFLATGAINTLSKKFQFQTCAMGEYVPSSLAEAGPCINGEKPFQKPWSQNLIMFTGEAFVFLLYLWRRSNRSIGSTKAFGQKSVPFYAFILPACCDVLGTGVGGVGMLYISASVWQMMRGSLIIFSSILSVVILRRQLHCYNWIAVLIAAIGLLLVGMSAILDEGGQSSNVLLGVGLTVCSQLFAAFQMVVEELFVKKYEAPPEQVVGSEGVWGIFIMTTILTAMFVAPGADGGSYENVLDSATMVASSGSLLALVFLYLVSISFFNFLGVTIAGRLSTVTRTINDALRTAIVWAVQLALFYVAGSETYGQAWAPHSWMQLIGFVFLISASLINHAILRLPCITYEEETEFRPMGNAMSPGAQGISVGVSPGTARLPAFSPVFSGNRMTVGHAPLGTLEEKLLQEGEGEMTLVEDDGPV